MDLADVVAASRGQGLGCMRLRESAGADEDRDPYAVIGHALDAGVALLDTADAYGNEELVGRAIRTRRSEVVLCSKFGLVWGEGRDWSVRADASYVQQACEASLRRLGVDVIDLYYLHHRSDTTPIEETVLAMADLVAAGKVRALGLSNVTADDLRRAHAVHPVAAVQEEWSLGQRDVERLVPTLVELGVTTVAHSPAGHGVLHAPSGTALADEPLAELRAALSGVAAGHDATPGHVALAWVHHRRQAWETAVVPLPGTTSVAHLRANIAAAELTLSASELARLDAASVPPVGASA
jgi:aryl-alcohol dehydrogenase-like predicted oxidoreductase